MFRFISLLYIDHVYLDAGQDNVTHCRHRYRDSSEVQLVQGMVGRFRLCSPRLELSWTLTSHPLDINSIDHLVRHTDGAVFLANKPKGTMAHHLVLT